MTLAWDIFSVDGVEGLGEMLSSFLLSFFSFLLFLDGAGFFFGGGFFKLWRGVVR